MDYIPFIQISMIILIFVDPYGREVTGSEPTLAQKSSASLQNLCLTLQDNFHAEV